LWPGRFVLQNAKLRFKDYNIEVGLDARELRLHVALLPLFRKEIRVKEVRAKDAKYQMLHRVHDAYKNRERIAAFPSIGFKRPKVYDSPQPAYGPPPFRIVVESIVGNAIEGWFLEYRVLGKFEVSGGFELDRNVRVLPGRVTIQDAKIFVGPSQIASAVNCNLQASLGPFPGDTGELAAILGTTDGKIQCTSRLDDLRAFRIYFPDSPLLLKGTGELQTDLRLVQGQLQNSNLKATLGIEQLGVSDAALRGTAQLTSTIEANGVAQVQAIWRGANPADAGVALEKTDLELEIAQPKVWQASLSKAKLELEGGALRDPTAPRRLTLKSDLPLTKVEARTLQLQYTSPEPSGQGSFEFSTEGAAAFFPERDLSVACLYEAKARCTLEPQEAHCSGAELLCAPVTFNLAASQKSQIAASIRAEKLELTEGALESEWSFFLGNPKGVLRAFVANDVWASLGLAVAPLGDVEGRVRVNRREQTIAGTVENFHSGLFSGKAGFVIADGVVSRWRVSTPVGRFGIEQKVSGTKVTPFVGDGWNVLEFASD